MSNDKICTEEKSPLLFQDEKIQENCKKGSKCRVHFEKTRFADISAGTTAVFTHFPNYIGTWWVTTAFFILLIFMMILLLFSSITITTLHIPRCVANEELDNQTVHLVHMEAQPWTEVELAIFERIIKNYPKYKIHLMLVQTELSLFITPLTMNIETKSHLNTILPKNLKNKRNGTKRIERRKRKFGMSMDATRLLDMLLQGKIWELNQTLPSTKTTHPTTTKPIQLKQPRNIDDLLKNNSDIILERTTFNRAFFNSPLYPHYKKLPTNLKIFAIRVIQLWQYGGISFDLGTNSTAIFEKKIMRFILSEKTNYKNLQNGVVAADDDGIHMESKIPCHAFFGQILMTLKQNQHKSVRGVLKTSVGVFCKYFAVEKKYCDKLQF